MEVLLFQEKDLKRMNRDSFFKSCSIYKEDNKFKILFFDSLESAYSILKTCGEDEKTYTSLHSAYNKILQIGLKEFVFWDKDYRKALNKNGS